MRKILLLLAVILMLFLILGCVTKAERAHLENILIDGDPLPGFRRAILQYNHALPEGAEIPVITPVKRNATDIVEITYPPDIPGAARITVKPSVTTGTHYLTTVYIISFYY